MIIDGCLNTAESSQRTAEVWTPQASSRVRARQEGWRRERFLARISKYRYLEIWVRISSPMACKFLISLQVTSTSRLFLGCIDTDFCKWILVGKFLVRSTFQGLRTFAQFVVSHVFWLRVQRLHTFFIGIFLGGFSRLLHLRFQLLHRSEFEISAENRQMFCCTWVYCFWLEKPFLQANLAIFTLNFSQQLSEFCRFSRNSKAGILRILQWTVWKFENNF